MFDAGFSLGYFRIEVYLFITAEATGLGAGSFAEHSLPIDSLTLCRHLVFPLS